jgi:hypothetical protein
MIRNKAWPHADGGKDIGFPSANPSQPMQRFCAEIMLKRDDESSHLEVTALSRQLGTGKQRALQEHRALFPPRRVGVQIFHPH